MPSGLQLFDPPLEITDRLTRLIGVYDADGSNGGVYVGVEELSTGIPCFIVVPTDDDMTKSLPAISFNDDTVFWNYPFSANATAKVFVFLY